MTKTHMEVHIHRYRTKSYSFLPGVTVRISINLNNHDPGDAS